MVKISSSGTILRNLFQIMVNTKTIAQILIFGKDIIYEKKVYKYLLKICKARGGRLSLTLLKMFQFLSTFVQKGHLIISCFFFAEIGVFSRTFV